MGGSVCLAVCLSLVIHILGEKIGITTAFELVSVFFFVCFGGGLDNTQQCSGVT